MLTRASKSVLPAGLLYDRLINKFVNGDMSVSVDGENSLPTLWRSSQNSSCTITGATVDTPTLSPDYKLSRAAKITITKADTVITSEKWLSFYQPLEGYQHRSLKPVTNVITFYARSNKLGTYNIALRARQPGYLPSFVSEFTITKNMEYERFIFIIPSVDTQLADEGDWTKDNSTSIDFNITLMAGANYIAANTDSWTRTNKICSSNQCNFADAVGNTFEVTGISIEANDSASPFEVPDHFLTNLLVDRYYRKRYVLWKTAYGANTTDVLCRIEFPKMRSIPSVSFTEPITVVNGNFVPCSYIPVQVDESQVVFYLRQSSVGIIRHQAYAITGTLVLSSFP